MGKKRKEKLKGWVPPEKRRGVLPPPPFRSWLEADVAEDLLQRGVAFKFEDTTFVYEQPAQLRKYLLDFELRGEGPKTMVIETKGRFTAEERKKMMLIQEQNPDVDLRMLFEKDNKLSRNSRMRYTDWCAKRGVKCAVGRTIPQEWLEELQ